MSMVDSMVTIDVSKDIDWATDFVWVANKTPLRVVGVSDDGRLKCVKPSGQEVTLDKSDADARYYPVHDGAVLKPHYRPLKAYVLTEPSLIILSGLDRVEMDEGAILMGDEGPISVDLTTYKLEYTVVGYRGGPLPTEPFGVETD